MNDWIDLDGLMKATQGMRGWSPSTIDRKARAREIVWRPIRQTGQAGRPPREYFVTSLPPEVQDRIRGQQPHVESLALACVQLAPSALSTPLLPAAPHATADAEERNVAELRYSIIRPFLDFCDHPKTEKPQPVNLNGRTIRTHDEMAKAIAKQWNTSRARIWEWSARCRKWGLPGLFDKASRSDKGQSRFFASHPKAAVYAAVHHLDQRKLGIRAIYRLLRENTRELEIAEMPSYETLRAHLDERKREMRIGAFVITPAMRIMAREGQRAYENKVAPFVRRGYDDVFANQVWCSDHGIRDVLVWNDCFYDFAPGVQLRLRLTGIADFRSRKILGFCFAVEGSSLSIVTAMRGPLMKFGPPEKLLVDNGEDYRKVGREICPAIGIDPQFCQPYHGQAKPIERFWRTMKEDFDILFRTYTGGKPELRPDETVVELARHKKLLAMGSLQESGLPPASHYVGLATVWMSEFNNHHHHTGEGMDGRTPNDVFEAYPNPRQKAPLTLDQLVFTLAERKRRKVHDCSVLFDNRRYIGVDDAAVARLHDIPGQAVIVAYDPNEPWTAAVLTVGNQFLCWVKPEKLLPHSDAAREDVKRMVSLRHRLRNETQEKIEGLRQLAACTGAANGLEILERKASVMPIAVGEFLAQRRPRIRPDDAAVAPPSPRQGARQLMENEAREVEVSE